MSAKRSSIAPSIARSGFSNDIESGDIAVRDAHRGDGVQPVCAERFRTLAATRLSLAAELDAGSG